MWHAYTINFFYIALADIGGRKLAIISGGTVFALGGAIQAGAVLIW